jgi:hypothetical protein
MSVSEPISVPDVRPAFHAAVTRHRVHACDLRLW